MKGFSLFTDQLIHILGGGGGGGGEYEQVTVPMVIVFYTSNDHAKKEKNQSLEVLSNKTIL